MEEHGSQPLAVARHPQAQRGVAGTTLSRAEKSDRSRRCCAALERLFEPLVAPRNLPGGLASREDRKQLADPVTLQVKLDGQTRARHPDRVDGHGAERADGPSRAAVGSLA